MARLYFAAPNLAFGPAPRTAGDVDALIAAGITHVVDCAGSPVTSRALGKRIAHDGVPVADTLKDLPGWWFEKAGRSALSALAAPDARVLVVCAQGRRRSPALAYWLLRRRGVDADSAVAAVRTARASISTVYFASAEAAL